MLDHDVAHPRSPIGSDGGEAARATQRGTGVDHGDGRRRIVDGDRLDNGGGGRDRSGRQHRPEVVVARGETDGVPAAGVGARAAGADRSPGRGPGGGVLDPHGVGCRSVVHGGDQRDGAADRITGRRQDDEDIVRDGGAHRVRGRLVARPVGGPCAQRVPPVGSASVSQSQDTAHVSVHTPPSRGASRHLL